MDSGVRKDVPGYPTTSCSCRQSQEQKASRSISKEFIPISSFSNTNTPDALRNHHLQRPHSHAHIPPATTGTGCALHHSHLPHQPHTPSFHITQALTAPHNHHPEPVPFLPENK